jgi:DNA-binding CsgD family transcriptional regulator
LARRDSAVHLLEREHELAAARAALAATCGGRGTLLLVEGEPGIGKSTLLGAVEGSAAAQGVRVLRARGGELEQPFALGCVRQWLAPVLGGRPALRRGPAAQATRLILGAPADGAGEPRPDAVLGTLLHGLHWIVADLADEAPLLLALDDAHWADAPSLRFVAYLGARLPDLPVTLAVTARAGERDEDGILDHVRTDAGATRLALRALSAAAVRTLVTRAFDDPRDDLSVACAELTGGNPFLVRETLAALGAEGITDAVVAARRAREIAPRPVARAAALTLRRLGAAAAALARAAAVLGDDVPVRQAAALATAIAPLQRSGDDAWAARAAAALAGAGLLRAGTPLGFAHPLLRSAVYQSVHPAERSVMHAAAARRLHADGAPAEAIAAQLRLTEPIAEPWARRALCDAAAASARAGHSEQAATLLREALSASPPTGERAALLAALARAEAAALDPRAEDRFRAAAAAADAPDDAALLRELAQFLHARGRHRAALAACEQALAVAGGDDLETLAEAGAIGFLVEGVGALMRVEPPATRIRLAPAQRAACAQLAGALMQTGEQRERAVALALRAWGEGRLLEACGPEDGALPILVGVLSMAGEVERADVVCAAMLDAAQTRGSLHGFANASYLRSMNWLCWGWPREAAADAERAWDAQADGWRAFHTVAAWVLTCARIDLGDVDGAAEAADAALAAESPDDPDNSIWVLRGAAGLAALARGDADAALRLLAERRDTGVRWGMHNPAVLPWQAAMARALLAVDRGREARALAREALIAARRWGSPQPIAAVLRALAAASEPERVARLHDAMAVTSCGDAPVRDADGVDRGAPAALERARVLAELGAALRRSGQRAAAREPLRAALSIASARGASGVATLAHDELLATGARPRRTRVDGVEALTPSELRVARMAARGLSNREIAQLLFVTVKAVKFHLSNAYRKLDVTSRHELAEPLGEA